MSAEYFDPTGNEKKCTDIIESGVPKTTRKLVGRANRDSTPAIHLGRPTGNSAVTARAEGSKVEQPDILPVSPSVALRRRLRSAAVPCWQAVS